MSLFKNYLRIIMALLTLNICNQYASEHYLLYNSKKSYSLCFTPKGVKFERPLFELDIVAISIVTECRYLGIIVNQRNCDADLKRQMRKFYANTNILLRKFSKCSPDVKCHLFKTFCANMYCSTMWYDSTKTAMSKLRIAYNNGLRRLLGIPTYNSAKEMFVILNIPSFGELLRKFAYSFRNRVMCSSNMYLYGICNSTVPLHSNIWSWWHDILTL